MYNLYLFYFIIIIKVFFFYLSEVKCGERCNAFWKLGKNSIKICSRVHPYI